MRLKPRKHRFKTIAEVHKIYDADTDEIVTVWQCAPYLLKCPILKTCLECNRCHVQRE